MNSSKIELIINDEESWLVCTLQVLKVRLLSHCAALELAIIVLAALRLHHQLTRLRSDERRNRRS